ncbi:DUF5522 domain-containing protein [Adhaeribacter soli]|uniref:DUF5522 domain-containing protein n=1 Tax=Adhaeribacter soli TaxID=2607655 RepID=UPI00177C80D8|nr:DUF5522 domain-containing protein [Adhaeribacter soli]
MAGKFYTFAAEKLPFVKKPPVLPLEPDDYYFNEQGLMVFTAKYHLKRGYCCKSGCKHCPYGFKKEPKLPPES